MPDEQQRGPFQHVLPSGQPVALGRPRASIYDDPRTHNVFRLARYIDRKRLGEPPEFVDNTEYLQPIMGKNDEIGDCTIVGQANYSLLADHMVGQTDVVITDQECIDRYAKLTGYDPATGEHDDGAVETQILDDWRKDPLDSITLLGYASVDVHDDVLLRHAINLFGAIYVGIDLPATAQDQSGTNTDWDATTGMVPGSWGGHCVILPRYDWRGPTRRLWAATWAYYQPMTQAFWRACGDEAYAPLPSVWLEHSRNGLNIDLLRKDLESLGRVRSPRPPER
jgi:hypothetical protein